MDLNYCIGGSGSLEGGRKNWATDPLCGQICLEDRARINGNKQDTKAISEKDPKLNWTVWEAQWTTGDEIQYGFLSCNEELNKYMQQLFSFLSCLALACSMNVTQRKWPIFQLRSLHRYHINIISTTIQMLLQSFHENAEIRLQGNIIRWARYRGGGYLTPVMISDICLNKIWKSGFITFSWKSWVITKTLMWQKKVSVSSFSPGPGVWCMA